jgi:hypothetical protein
MKWYFALNETSLRHHPALWEAMILTAVRSCRQHTDLEPHFVFDGGAHPFVSQLEAEGVTVVRHRVPFMEAIEAYAPHDDYTMIAAGAFLRVEIPALERDDEFVLYTDCDVIFTGPVELDDLSPRTLASVPEFDLDVQDDLNSGVMLLNVPALRAELPAFREFISANLADFAAVDQGAYRAFYRGRSEPLPPRYNWRPYWGISDEARIVHFHGPKPCHVLQMLFDRDESCAEVYRLLFDRDHQAYRHYLAQWLAVAGDSAAWI